MDNPKEIRRPHKNLGGVFLSNFDLAQNRNLFIFHNNEFIRLLPSYRIALKEWDWRRVPITQNLTVDFTSIAKDQYSCDNPSTGQVPNNQIHCREPYCGSIFYDPPPSCGCFASINSMEACRSIFETLRTISASKTFNDLTPDMVTYPRDYSELFLFHSGNQYVTNMEDVFNFLIQSGAIIETFTEDGGWWCPSVSLANSFQPYTQSRQKVCLKGYGGTSSIQMAKYFLRVHGPLVACLSIHQSLEWYGYIYGNMNTNREGHGEYLFSHHKFADECGYQGPDDDNVSGSSNSPVNGKHAVVVVGYKEYDTPLSGYYDEDDNPIDVEGYWKVRNSWGTDWGDHGDFYLPYGTVTKNGITEPYGECGIGLTTPFYFLRFKSLFIHPSLKPFLIGVKHLTDHIIEVAEEMSALDFLDHPEIFDRRNLENQ